MAEVMTQTTTRPPLNGVDTPTLFATIDVVKANPPLAKFRFRSTHRWLSGTHSQGTIETFSGAGADHTHKQTFTLDADHPAVLVGQDNGPLPVEYVLNALGSCIMSGIANIAAARGPRWRPPWRATWMPAGFSASRLTCATGMKASVPHFGSRATRLPRNCAR